MRYSTTILLVVVIGIKGLAAVPSDFSADTVRTHIQHALAPVAQLLHEDPSGGSAQIYLNNQRLIVDVIQPYFYNSGLGELSRKSPIRDARVTEVEAWLAPYQSILIAATERSATQTSFPNAAVDLLKFARPSETLKSALQEVAHSTVTKPDRAVDAYNALFMLQLDDPKIRNEVLNFISWRGERSVRAGLGKQLLQSAANRWGMIEMESLYRDFLSIAYKPDNYPAVGGRGALLAQYRAAIAGLAAFGTDAKSFTDLIKARIAEMNLEDGDEANFIRRANESLEILEGKRVPTIAINWKGQLLGVSKRTYPQWLSQQSPMSGTPPSSHLVAGVEKDSKTPGVAQSPAIASDESPVSKPSRWWPWGMGGVLLLTLVVFLARKSK